MRKCIERMAQENILKSGRIRIVLYDARDEDPPAFVTFDPEKTMHIDKDVWEESDYNIPWNRKVLGHEAGHLIHHAHYVQGFSGAKSKAWPDEESSEWQADRFGDHLLVTDRDLALYKAPNAIANHCAVELDLAFRRLGNSFRYGGEACRECGNFTMVRNGTCLKCDTCGATTGCS
jgi:hypothetical protein